MFCDEEFNKYQCCLIDWTTMIKIEKENKQGYYIKNIGYFEAMEWRNCGSNECTEKKIKEIRHIKYDRVKRIRNWEKRYKISKEDYEYEQYWKWNYYLVKKEQVELLKEGVRLNGEFEEYVLLRVIYKEEWERFEILGYNGEKFFVKQTINRKIIF